MKINEISREKIIHILVGGGLCFIALFVIEALVLSIMDLILRALGIYGVMAYQEGRDAFFLIRLGAVYLTSGFLGGLYTGYRIKESLKKILVFPAIVCFLGIIVLQLITGYMSLIFSTATYFIKSIVMPLSILIAGSYLGGYTLNWHVEEKPKEEEIKIVFKEEYVL